LKRTLTIIHRGEAEAEQAKKELIEANLRLLFPSQKNIPIEACSSWT